MTDELITKFNNFSIKNKKLGQYFTKNLKLKEKLFSFILNDPSIILEPSIGQGDLIDYIKQKIPKTTFDMFEIDKSIKLLNTIDKNEVIYCDFIKYEKITKRYKTIVGNPPYIKTKNGNMYIKFIEKCYDLLDLNGELIFIIPSDFFKLTSSVKILNIMINNGSFTHIFHPHNEKLFQYATIDIIIFRYCKNNTKNKTVLYNDNLMYLINTNGLITFEKEIKNNNNLFADYFDIYVGIVSGKDEIYKHETLGNIKVLTGINKLDKYIYIDRYPSDNKDIDDYLLKNKEILLKRKIKKFTDKNWFEWGAPRNITKINNNLDKECIYMYNLTRQLNEVAFLGKVNYFSGNLIILIPKKQIDLTKILSYINSNTFTTNFIYSNRFKIGHRQISNSSIPTEFIKLLETNLIE
jgi:adenine-specific DNA-methyltransferase